MSFKCLKDFKYNNYVFKRGEDYSPKSNEATDYDMFVGLGVLRKVLTKKENGKLSNNKNTSQN